MFKTTSLFTIYLFLSHFCTQRKVYSKTKQSTVAWVLGYVLI